jgi:hypothetical protein
MSQSNCQRYSWSHNGSWRLAQFPDCHKNSAARIGIFKISPGSRKVSLINLFNVVILGMTEESLFETNLKIHTKVKIKVNWAEVTSLSSLLETY